MNYITLYRRLLLFHLIFHGIDKPARSFKKQEALFSVNQASISRPSSARADTNAPPLFQDLLNLKAAAVLPVYEMRACMTDLVRIAFYADINLHRSFHYANVCSHLQYNIIFGVVNASLFGYTRYMKRLIILFFITCLLCCFGCKQIETKLDVYAFSVGKADALFVCTDEAAIMIDTGENGDGDRLVSRLHALGVEKLDLLILTHFDKDHIGGADTIIKEIPIDRIVLPSYEKESKQYTQLLAVLKQTNAEVSYLTQDLQIQYGALDLSVWVSDVPYDGESDNEQSLITKIIYDGRTYLFMGDAENAALRKLVFGTRNLTCDVLKLPHHGVYDESTFALMTASMPSYVIICDSGKNPADEQTMKTLSIFDPVILQTKNGEIHLTVINGVIESE